MYVSPPYVEFAQYLKRFHVEVSQQSSRDANSMENDEATKACVH